MRVVVRLEGQGTYEERYAAGFRKAFGLIEQVLQARKQIMRAPNPTWTAVLRGRSQSRPRVTLLR